MTSFNSSVWDAAKAGNLNDLTTALALYPHLIDIPHPYQARETPMYIAAQNGHVVVIEKLVELGSKAIDTFNSYPWTPIHAAADTGQTQVIETLVRLGSCAIDTPDNHGWTPLHIAAKNGHMSMVETLVRLGSRAIDTPDMYGCTPLSSTICYNRKGCIKTLKMLGAKCSTIPFTYLSAKKMRLLNEQVNEDESAKVRERVYFQRSLLERLLVELDRRSFTINKKIYLCFFFFLIFFSRSFLLSTTCNPPNFLLFCLGFLHYLRPWGVVREKPQMKLKLTPRRGIITVS